MDEECVDVPMVTEVTMSGVVGLRRHSSGKAGSGNNEEKVVPHYLRASTGSCHDFCKYGRKLALEAKKRSSIPKRAERKALHQNSEVSIGGITTSVTKLRSSIDSELQISDSLDTIEQENATKGSEVLVNKNRTSLIRGKSSSKSHISSTPKTRWQKVSSSFELDTSSKPTSKRVRASSISTSKKEEPQLKSNSERVKTHPKSTSQVVKTSSKSASKKARTSLKSSSPLRDSMSSKSSGKRLAGINIDKSLKTESRVMNQSKPRKVEPEEQNNEVQEKTLYVIKVENVTETFQSDQTENQDIELSPSHSLSSVSTKFSSSSISQFSSQEDQEESEYPTSEFEEDCSSEKDGKEEYIEKVETFEVEEKGKPQKDDEVIVYFEDKNCKKLREKLVETEIEKSGPRKLTFKRGKVLEVSATDIKADAENSIPEKVVLRHQDVEGKNVGQVLLNNVIEERASKLVETQKSKVKALVDAFETIISLNEKNVNAVNTVN